MTAPLRKGTTVRVPQEVHLVAGRTVTADVYVLDDVYGPGENPPYEVCIVVDRHQMREHGRGNDKKGKPKPARGIYPAKINLKAGEYLPMEERQ